MESQNLQLVRLGDEASTNQRFHITAMGRPLNQEAGICTHCDYKGTDRHEGLLQGRYTHFTPFYVPRYDEASASASTRAKARHCLFYRVKLRLELSRPMSSPELLRSAMNCMTSVLRCRIKVIPGSRGLMVCFHKYSCSGVIAKRY